MNENDKEIEDIIREKNVKKETDLQKEAHKIVVKSGTFYNLITAAYSGLIGVLGASSNVLQAAGSAIPIVGVAFQLLGTVIGGIGSTLDPKASIGAKGFALFMAAVVIALTAAGFATAGAAAGPIIGFVALGMGVTMGGLQFVGSMANYFALKKEREVADDVREIVGQELKKQNNPNMAPAEIDKINLRIAKLENRVGEEKLLEKLKILQVRLKDNLERKPSGQQGKIDEIIKSIEVVTKKIEKIESIGKNKKIEIDQKIEKTAEITPPEKKLEQLYQERKELVNNYVNDMKLFESYPKAQKGTVAEGIDNLAKTHRKALMAIDKQIEEIIQPDAYIRRGLNNAEKGAIDSGASFLLALAGVGITLFTIALPAAAMAFGAAVGVVGFAKLAVNVAVEYQDKKAEKERKEQDKSGIQEEILGEVNKLEHQSSHAMMRSVFKENPANIIEDYKSSNNKEPAQVISPIEKSQNEKTQNNKSQDKRPQDKISQNEKLSERSLDENKDKIEVEVSRSPSLRI